MTDTDLDMWITSWCVLKNKKLGIPAIVQWVKAQTIASRVATEARVWSLAQELLYVTGADKKKVSVMKNETKEVF